MISVAKCSVQLYDAPAQFELSLKITCGRRADGLCHQGPGKRWLTGFAHVRRQPAGLAPITLLNGGVSRKIRQNCRVGQGIGPDDRGHRFIHSSQ